MRGTFLEELPELLGCLRPAATLIEPCRQFVLVIGLVGVCRHQEQRPLETLRSYVERERAYAGGRERQFDRLYKYGERAFQDEFAEYLRRVRASGGIR